MISENVIVTGSSGYIGERLTEFFKKRTRARVWYCDIDSNLDPCDIRNYDEVFNFFSQPDDAMCVHLAAKADVGVDKDVAMETNVGGTQNVVDVCDELDIPLVNISSVAAKNPDAHPYAKSKREQERVVRKSNLDSITVRLPNIVGPGHQKGNVKAMIDDGITDGIVEAWYDGRGVRTYVSRDTVCRFLTDVYNYDSLSDFKMEYRDVLTHDTTEIQGVDMMTYTVGHIVADTLSDILQSDVDVRAYVKEARSPRVLTTEGIPTLSYPENPHTAIKKQVVETVVNV